MCQSADILPGYVYSIAKIIFVTVYRPYCCSYFTNNGNKHENDCHNDENSINEPKISVRRKRVGQANDIPMPPRRVPVQVDEVDGIVSRERVHVERARTDVFQVYGVVIERQEAPNLKL